MQVREIMTSNPACCGPQTSLVEVAQLMVEHDCGCVPVVDDAGRPLGMVTDRDITCRLVAQSRNPLDLTAQESMTSPCVSLPQTAAVDECCRLMGDKQIRRVLITDSAGRCCGIVSQADFSTDAQQWTGEMVHAIFRPTQQASDFGAQ